MKADIGLIGLAVMGQNLVLNMNDRGYHVAVFNRTVSKVDLFLEGPAKGTNVIGTKSLKEFFGALKRPRKVMFMVQAGAAVDALIEECLPFLEKGDIVIDGGNSFYPDSQRRHDELKAKGIIFIGAGISGGEEGARHGPSIMPGGNHDGWEAIKPIFQAICAKSEDGTPCCDWVGSGGAGHYVKMVHNGIEYGDMQLICEAYFLMKELLGAEPDELSSIFGKWNEGDLDSYLIEITRDIFKFKDPKGGYLVDKIVDSAGQKGTGKWTGINAFELGIPVTLIGEAVFARCISSMRAERERASKLYPKPHYKFSGDRNKMIENIRCALFASKIISYAQGFMLMRAASNEMKWDLNYASIAMMWREGCIIRSRFLKDIASAYTQNPALENLLQSDFFRKKIGECEHGWREVVSASALSGVATPCFSAALSFLDGYRSARLPANLLQAQRDYFGAHTYERLDEPKGTFFHTNWTGTGGSVSSSTYNV